MSKRNIKMASVALLAMLAVSFPAGASKLKDFVRDLDRTLNAPPPPGEHELYIAPSYSEFEANRLRERLALTDDQTARVRDILKEAYRDTELATTADFPFAFRAAEERHSDTEARIDAILDPDQHRRFNDFRDEWRRKDIQVQITHRLRDQLALNEEQTRKVREIVRYAQQERDRIRDQYRKDEPARLAALRDLRHDAEDSIRGVLHDDQRDRYAQLLEQNRERLHALREVPERY